MSGGVLEAGAPANSKKIVYEDVCSTNLCLNTNSIVFTLSGFFLLIFDGGGVGLGMKLDGGTCKKKSD